MKQRRIEEQPVALGQSGGYMVVGEVLNERIVGVCEVSVRIEMGEGEKTSRTRPEGHVRVRHSQLQREELGGYLGHHGDFASGGFGLES
jgi:hypothetical protein